MADEMPPVKKRLKPVEVRYAALMMTSLFVTAAVLAATAAEQPALVVQGSQTPVTINRAVVITPSTGPSVLLYAAESQTDQRLDEFTVIAFVFRADGTLKAKQIAPGRRTLEPREIKYSTLVLDGSNIEPTDIVVAGINQAQLVGSNDWWRADLQPAAEAAVPLKK
jgi:hypothetical protein